jgi:hypothetical protein
MFDGKMFLPSTMQISSIKNWDFMGDFHHHNPPEKG